MEKTLTLFSSEILHNILYLEVKKMDVKKMDELNDSPWHSAVNIFLLITSASLWGIVLFQASLRSMIVKWYSDTQTSIFLLYKYFKKNPKPPCNSSISQTKLVVWKIFWPAISRKKGFKGQNIPVGLGCWVFCSLSSE